MMRVVHLLTSDGGGAGRAALRLHHGLLASGVDSSMLVKEKTSADAKVREVPALEARHDPSAVLLRAVTSNLIWQNRSPVSNTHYTLGYPGWDLSSHPDVLAADVIHLHWVADWLTPVSIARLQDLGTPMVWTLHDQRPFTGGCHFSAGCVKYTEDCVRCPQLREDPWGLARANLRDQSKLFQPGSIRVVAPSVWLAQAARESAVFRNFKVDTIPYSLDTETFKPMPQADARAQLGLPAAGVFLLFGAANAAERRKGFAEFLAAISICGRDGEFAERARAGLVSLLCFGQPGDGLDPSGIPLHSLGTIDSDERLAAVYAAADLFVLPTLEDNLPNTMLEALSCGTPVVAFGTGGVPDMMADGKTGRVTPVGDTALLALAILDLARNPEAREAMRGHCRDAAVRQFALGIQAGAYSKVYRELVGNAKKRRTPPREAQPAFTSELAPHMAGILKPLMASPINGVPIRVRALEDFYGRRFDELRQGGWPWLLNPKAWRAGALWRAFRRVRRAREKDRAARP